MASTSLAVSLVVLPQMLVWIIVIGLLVVAVLTFLTLKIRSSGRVDVKRSPAPQVLSSRTPTFNLVALGAKETGKTVFLSSMFHQLSTERKSGGFRLMSEDDVELTQTLSLVSSGGWPMGTFGGRTYTFDCVDDSSEPVLRFDYYDYAGELVDGSWQSKLEPEERRRQTKELKEKIDAAHVLFGIIDGQRMVDDLTGKDRQHSYLRFTIAPMIEWLIKGSRGGRRPIYLILTKWDELHKVDVGPDVNDPDAKNNARLKAVREALLRRPAIRDLVKKCMRHNQPVRLIPVSSVGLGVLEDDPDGGWRRVRADAELSPVHVGVPLFAVLPDLFEQVEQTLSPEVQDEIEAEGRRLRRRDSAQPAVVVAECAEFLTSTPGLALRSAFGHALGVGLFTEPVAELFLYWAAGIDGGRRRPTGAVRAQRVMVEEFLTSMIVLSFRFPASDLADGE